MREVKSKETIATPSLEMAHPAGSVLKLCRKAWLGPEFILPLHFFPSNNLLSSALKSFPLSFYSNIENTIALISLC